MYCGRRVKRILTGGVTCWAAAAVLGFCAGGLFPTRAAEPENGGLDVVQIRPNFYMIAGAGGNIAVEIGVDGVVLVDAGKEDASGEVLAALHKITELPIRYIIDTGADADHVGGNGNLSKAGKTIFVNALGNSTFLNAMTNGGGASILAHDSILQRMSAPTGEKAAFPAASWPTEAFYDPTKYLRMNDEAIEVMHQPAAHSNADSFVLFRKSDVVAAGDILDLTRFPVIDVARGGSIQGEIDALNKLISLVIPPGPFIYEGTETFVVPGHGRVCRQLDVVDYRDMVVEVRDVVADMIKSGMTLQQIQEASPAKPYETEYGTQPGVTSSFIESVYKSLTAKK